MKCINQVKKEQLGGKRRKRRHRIKTRKIIKFEGNNAPLPPGDG